MPITFYIDVSLIKYLVGLLTVGLLVMIPLTNDVMSAAKLSLASVLIYSSANALEGIVLSLFSKVISARLATGTFNSGFLATEAGTFGRSCGNALISVLGQYLSLNLLERAITLQWII